MATASQTVTNKKSHLAERIAFDPFLPQQDLINELVRNMITPDTDIGQVYYLGQIIDIIKSENENVEIRDVFYSASDNFERATKNASDKKYNSKRIILLVHIPSFITNSNNTSTGNILNYNSFTKLRIEYTLEGKKTPKIGNIVKVQFRDKNSFYDPYVTDIEDIDSSKVDIFKNKAKEVFDEYLNCKALSIKFPTEIGKIDYNSLTKPAGGYVQALKEIENIFSASFINGFLKSVSKDFLEPSKIIIQLRTVKIHENAYLKFKQFIKFKNDNIILDSFSDKDQNYLIKGEEVLFSLPQQEKETELRNKFYAYVRQEFSSKLNYSFAYKPNDPKFTVDMNLNLLFGSKVPTLNDYIEVSDKLKDSTTYYSRITTAGSSPQTIKKKELPDECESKIADDKGLYQFVYNLNNKKDNYNKDHNSVDNTIVKMFYDNKIIPENFLNQDYYLKLINRKDLKELTTINPTFYKSSGSTDDTYGSKNNVCNVNSMIGYLGEITNFLKQMRLNISQNEPGITLSDVLIVPRQVIKIKKGIVSKNQDPNSRHFYGKAVDIAVYLRLNNETENKKIVQIPPEIVVLYAEKTREQRQILGYGILLEQKNKFYTHIEFLTGTYIIKNGKSTQITANERIYTGNVTDFEKDIEKSPNKLDRLRAIINSSINYKNPNTGIIDDKIRRLLT